MERKRLNILIVYRLKAINQVQEGKLEQGLFWSNTPSTLIFHIFEEVMLQFSSNTTFMNAVLGLISLYVSLVQSLRVVSLQFPE